MQYSEKIAQSVEKYLKDLDYSFDYDQFHGTFAVEAELSCKLNTCLVVLQITESDIMSYASLNTDVPALRRVTMGEYLHRANYGLPRGNFEFSYDDGSIQFKTYIPCPTQSPTKADLDDCFAVPLSVIDHYGDGIVTLLSQELSPAAGIIKELDGEF